MYRARRLIRNRHLTTVPHDQEISPGLLRQSLDLPLLAVYAARSTRAGTASAQTLDLPHLDLLLSTHRGGFGCF